MISEYRPELEGSPKCPDCGAVMVQYKKPLQEVSWHCMSCGRAHEGSKHEAPEVPDLYRLAFMPGVFRCSQCDFLLSKQTFNTSAGIVGVSESDRETEECPNDGTMMVPVTYREQLAVQQETIVRLRQCESWLRLVHQAVAGTTLQTAGEYVGKNVFLPLDTLEGIDAALDGDRP